MLTVPRRFVEATITREGEAGRRWIEALPELAAGVLARWQCAMSGPVMHGFVGVVIPAIRADGQEVVLKLGFPANTAEAVALAAWNGNGAARLLASDDSGAMLLERLQPLEKPASIAEIGRLARRLAIPAPRGLNSLADRARAWMVDVPKHAARLGHPLPSRVIDACVANVRDLAVGQPDSLVHGDLHLGNVLRGGEELKAIDPSGLAGDPAYELLPVLRDDWPAVMAEADPRRAVARRIAEFAEAAEVDRERVHRWTQARAAESALWSRQLDEPDAITELVDTIATMLV
ncbi:aminoglycoside phosphotransferase family protein [Kutzneria buriramensis]|uniref:Streptomycin 6-kinase n=1 Tax=Kutzneria buriramensis TaxID=1045776 RepID=A0A3E0GWH8_9PSEU|nr:aminoglycoside phosphotransferase family protein [Kutzneria buriramensis]REH32483.1 streptomycin 6-kinase [Kutzneria buriramensis]